MLRNSEKEVNYERTGNYRNRNCSANCPMAFKYNLKNLLLLKFRKGRSSKLR